MSSSISDYAGVYPFIARFVGLKWLKRKEPRPSMEVETVLAQACHRIDEQDLALKLRDMQLRLRDVEIELLQSDAEWLLEIISKTNVVLGTNDYIRLQQVAIKVRATRSKLAH